VEYPSQYEERPAVLHAGDKLCWLELGSSDKQRTRSKFVHSNGETKETTYTGIGISVTSDATTGYYTLHIISNDTNGATTTGGQTLFSPPDVNHTDTDFGVPLGTAFACNDNNQGKDVEAVSYIDLQQTEFIIDPSYEPYYLDKVTVSSHSFYVHEIFFSLSFLVDFYDFFFFFFFFFLWLFCSNSAIRIMKQQDRHQRRRVLNSRLNGHTTMTSH
jgi:hypothetical protein